jgi:hypothetical protein
VAGTGASVVASGVVSGGDVSDSVVVVSGSEVGRSGSVDVGSGEVAGALVGPLGSGVAGTDAVPDGGEVVGAGVGTVAAGASGTRGRETSVGSPTSRTAATTTAAATSSERHHGRQDRRAGATVGGSAGRSRAGVT